MLSALESDIRLMEKRVRLHDEQTQFLSLRYAKRMVILSNIALSVLSFNAQFAFAWQNLNRSRAHAEGFVAANSIWTPGGLFSRLISLILPEYAQPQSVLAHSFVASLASAFEHSFYFGVAAWLIWTEPWTSVDGHLSTFSAWCRVLGLDFRARSHNISSTTRTPLVSPSAYAASISVPSLSDTRSSSTVVSLVPFSATAHPRPLPDDGRTDDLLALTRIAPTSSSNSLYISTGWTAWKQSRSRTVHSDSSGTPVADTWPVSRPSSPLFESDTPVSAPNISSWQRFISWLHWLRPGLVGSVASTAASIAWVFRPNAPHRWAHFISMFFTMCYLSLRYVFAGA